MTSVNCITVSGVPQVSLRASFEDSAITPVTLQLELNSLADVGDRMESSTLSQDLCVGSAGLIVVKTCFVHRVNIAHSEYIRAVDQLSKRLQFLPSRF